MFHQIKLIVYVDLPLKWINTLKFQGANVISTYALKSYVIVVLKFQ